jgi:hypothetical protein
MYEKVEVGMLSFFSSKRKSIKKYNKEKKCEQI